MGQYRIGSDGDRVAPGTAGRRVSRRRNGKVVFIERYQRRARSVDSALLGCYLSGANGRRIRGALSPLLRGAPLSKSAISRIVGRLQVVVFTVAPKRSLKGESVVFLYLDAIALRVRIANKVVSAPVLVAVGVKADGEKVVLDLELVGERVQ